ncbi:peptide/nickel transport system substrate-binding protein [Williamsia limnetica]|uniref:Peptide/nickel transport system substrate-binding protein n=1 Tax=Williamsia limnetica TaxID=882452 RepID=A0A318RLI1_WILLI|nr:ABC transporter substrate-binding protein [Williamsia limnetica]PYE16395.1 peptide/nickel transport system substrate-binding protein [Williamsia limnetica]
MFRPRRITHYLAVIFSAALLVFLTACGGGGNSTGTSAEDEGEPVPGGTLRVIQTGEPRSLDPAALSNTWAHQPVVGNGLYGTLMINNIENFTIEYKMATDFSTTDNGQTFNLALRPDLKFTDGTPLDAAAVKFNWDRLKDPSLGSTSIRQAIQVANTEVVDPTNLKVTLAAPNPHFAESLVAGALNWIASPAALQKGRESFDQNPVGAGPFKLTNWTRQASIDMEKNPAYYDAPKPYLDKITVVTVADSNTRASTMTTGAADLSSETNQASINKAQAAGLKTEVVPTGGGQYMGMNERRAPFNDQRARKAVALATDVAGLNTIVYNGEGTVPETLFDEQSPFFTDVALQQSNKDEAQQLFNELAAEGKPVSFTFLSYPTTESRTLAEGLQTQLSGYDNVEVKIEVVDFGAATARAGARDFDMIISSAVIQDPDFPLWTAFHSKSPGNFVGTNDPELDAALDAGRIEQDVQARKDSYNTVQERIAEIVPGVWYSRAIPSVVYAKNVSGVDLYTLGSPLPENIWMN